MAKKPTLETHSTPCCGECYYLHETPEDKKQVGCFVEPPQYLYGDQDDPIYGQFKPISVTRYVCKDFKRKGTH